MDPWKETDVDLDDMKTIVRLNGKVVSRFPTNNMIIGIAHYIAENTKYITLCPRDMIWMGTDGASENMKSGDPVDVEITGIGILSNTIVERE